MDDDWDLHAVVRGCSAASSSATSSSAAAAAAPPPPPCSFEPRQEAELLCFSDVLEFGASTAAMRGFNEELHDLYKPFFPPPQPPPPSPPPTAALPISPLSVIGGLPDLSPTHQNLKPHISSSPVPTVAPTTIIHPKKQPSFSAALHTTQSPRSKRRKNQMKRVCQVPAEALSSDVWSWRKYGQKPIKGSPYPRGYYRCSTSKGCLARKQVERNRSDPSMFIVTYTAEHNHPMPTHRNSLAGSTRPKPTTTTSTTTTSGDDSSKPAASPPEKQESSSSSRDKEEEEDIIFDDADEEDDEFGLSKITAPDDDFFEGLENLDDLATTSTSTALQFPWLATTTAAGGG